MRLFNCFTLLKGSIASVKLYNEAIPSLIEYIYTDSASDINESLHQLAVKYKLPRLSAVCDYKLNGFDVNLLLEHPSTLSSDVKAVYLNEEPKEDSVHLVSAENTSIYVPKFILMSTEYFASMLHSGMQESVTSKINLPEISENILHIVVAFIITGFIESEDGNQLMEILAAANHLCMSNLINLCELLLIQQIDNDNVQVLQEFAEKFNAKLLLSNCNAFIKKENKVIILLFPLLILGTKKTN
jgi:hypothetical protein